MQLSLKVTVPISSGYKVGEERPEVEWSSSSRRGRTGSPGAQITKDAIGAILLLPDIDKEAVAKAAAIGTSGIIGTDIKEDLFAYLQSRKIDLPVISVAPETGKKIIRSKMILLFTVKSEQLFSN